MPPANNSKLIRNRMKPRGSGESVTWKKGRGFSQHNRDSGNAHFAVLRYRILKRVPPDRYAMIRTIAVLAVLIHTGRGR
jgi:hypothetical protein